MTMTTAGGADNGVDVEALLGARQALAAAPEAGQFTFRATNVWASGAHSHSTVERFFGLGAEQRHRRPYTVETDHPDVFAGTDTGPTPPELVLMGLVGCLSAAVASVAQHRGIQLRAVQATIEGDVDIAGILGVDPDVRNGFGRVAVRYHIDADASPQDLEALVAQAQKRSAVFDIVANPTTIVVELG